MYGRQFVLVYFHVNPCTRSTNYRILTNFRLFFVSKLGSGSVVNISEQNWARTQAEIIHVYTGFDKKKVNKTIDYIVQEIKMI